MSDNEIRRLERLAAEGDALAAEKVERARLRAMTPESLLNTGCWWAYGADSYAGTVVATWRNAQQITVQRDRPLWSLEEVVCTRFERDPEGERKVFTKRRDGLYRERGGTTLLRLGDRQAYGSQEF